MDVRYVSLFVDSIRTTIEAMCGVNVDVAKPGLTSCNATTSDVSVVIGFSGDAAGFVVLHFGFEVASKLASAFSQMTITPAQAAFADAISELANRIAGGAKEKFEGLSINVALPNVFVGESQSVFRSKTSPRLVIPCTTKLGTFEVEIGTENQEPAVIKNEPATVGANS